MAAVGRIEYDGPAQLARLENLKGRIELVGIHVRGRIGGHLDVPTRHAAQMKAGSLKSGSFRNLVTDAQGFMRCLPAHALMESVGAGDDGFDQPFTSHSGDRTVTIKILLAEDDTDMRRFLVKALQTAGYDVISYDNGLAAYQRLREEPFELLLTDIVMPEMDGIELARRATELDPDIKIMFITGFAAVALNGDSSTPRQAKVLSKPFHLRELVNEVGKMLAA